MELTIRSTTPRIFVSDQSFVGSARRAVRDLAEQAGLQSDLLAKLDLVSTELATNLAKHAAGGGELLFFDASKGESKAVQLLSVDRGPGIADIEDVFIDGNSSKGTLGAGLGSIKRLSDSCEFSSTLGKGTVVLCTISQAPKRNSIEQTLEVAAISTPHFAETNSGDGVSISYSDDATSILVVDGLGHGNEAAHAAEIAARIFGESPFDSPASLVDRIHNNLVGTRGIAMALVQIDRLLDKLTFIGVGNITGRVYTRYASKGCVSVQGIVGGRMPSAKEFCYDWEPGASLLLYSDGIKSAAVLPEVQSKSALLEAAEIYRDFSRTNDDTTVVVVRDKRRR
jgi:anti-sigma regulatory factor (Ser/Thr protein kinase)